MNEKYSRQGVRIARVIARSGLPAAQDWARRTAGIYRVAVLERGPFPHAGACRRQFIESYLELKRFAVDGKLQGIAEDDVAAPATAGAPLLSTDSAKAPAPNAPPGIL